MPLLRQQLHGQDGHRKNPAIESIVAEISPDSIRRNVGTLVSFKTRHTLSDTSGGTTGIGAARRWILSEFERYAKSSNGKMTAEFHETLAPPSQRIPHPTKIVNVIATLRPPSSHPHTSNQVFLVSGHYDSRASNPLDSTSGAPGADDDGSGTALVLELARVFSHADVRSTIKFVAFAGEEQGLNGSSALASLAKEQQWNITGVLNNDIVGSSHGGNGEIESSYVRLFSEAYGALDTGGVFRQRNSLGLESDGPSRTLARYIKETAEQYVAGFSVKLIYRRDRFLRGGDHSSFNEKGFAAVRFTEAKENFDRQHQDVRTENGRSYGDLPEFMDFEYCARIARANAAALASLALAPVAPSNAEIMTKNLEYGTSLRWDKNTGADLTGYIVRYRETTSPTWQYQSFTTDTTLTLKISKDDYLFGVQAVDKDGNASLISVPKPVR
ncbi:MAG TPA: M28 family metallopeptidase [Bacteroidota bacterium]|nr:M28 family metallopeptidase [Bacteroidota bacterium]